jgi:hypothetical protein
MVGVEGGDEDGQVRGVALLILTIPGLSHSDSRFIVTAFALMTEQTVPRYIEHQSEAS